MLFFIAPIVAMEIEDGQQPICYLALLPADIHDHIASYLIFNDRESDDEFIARTRTAGTITSEHSAMINKHENYKFTVYSTRGTLRTYSVDCSKIITLERQDEPKVTILDIQHNTMKESAKLAELSRESIKSLIGKIALSRTGSHYAQLRDERRQESFNERVSYKDCLLIKNVLSSETQQFPIPSQYNNFISIGFNKQGTKIIVHANKYGTWELIPEDETPEIHYMVLLVSQEEHEEKSKKTLAHYLRHICCCDDLKKSLKSYTMEQSLSLTLLPKHALETIGFFIKRPGRDVLRCTNKLLNQTIYSQNDLNSLIIEAKQQNNTVKLNLFCHYGAFGHPNLELLDAVKNNHKSLTRWLLPQAVGPLIKRNCLQETTRRKNTDIARIILTSCETEIFDLMEEVVFMAAKNGHIELLKYLGSTLRYRTPYYLRSDLTVALHYAKKNNDSDMIRLLEEHVKTRNRMKGINNK